eukprot:14552667-Alexandrium_andersonii.AAC.1
MERSTRALLAQRSAAPWPRTAERRREAARRVAPTRRATSRRRSAVGGPMGASRRKWPQFARP